jgi:hypothetical protein
VAILALLALFGGIALAFSVNDPELESIGWGLASSAGMYCIYVLFSAGIQRVLRSLILIAVVVNGIFIYMSFNLNDGAVAPILIWTFAVIAGVIAFISFSSKSYL